MKTEMVPKLLSGSSIALLGRKSGLTINREESIPKSTRELKKTLGPSKTMMHTEPGRIIDAKYRWIQELDLEQYIEKTGMLQQNKALLTRFVQDARLGKTIKQGAKKKIDKPRLIKYVQDLKKLDAYCRKPFDAIDQVEMERFILDLEEGRLVQTTGKPYGAETQVCIKKIVIKFYKWLNGGKKPNLVDWIDTSYKIKDYRAPREEQIRNILDRMSSNDPGELMRNRALIMVLFDSGARADELGNVRLEHISKEEGIYKMRIAFSKTRPRTVSLPLCTEHLDKWLSVHPFQEDRQKQLFPMTYTAMHHMIKRAGKRAAIKMTPHTIRHASATYWARHLSRYQLCQRMGWALSSKQPDRYIDQEGLGEEKVKQIVEQNTMQRMATENAQLNRRLAMMEEQLERLLKADKEELRQIIKKVVSENGGAL